MSLNSLLTYKGETLTVAEWARRTGLKDKTIYMRIRSGWTPERTLERPLQKGLVAKDWQERHNAKAQAERDEERRQIREWLRTQPSHIDERREEGDIL